MLLLYSMVAVEAGHPSSAPAASQALWEVAVEQDPHVPDSIVQAVTDAAAVVGAAVVTAAPVPQAQRWLLVHSVVLPE